MPDETVNDISKSSFCADYIVIATKALPDIDIASLIKPKVSKNTAIVIIQNGIDIEIPLHKAFPDNEIISCIAFICVTREQYGKVSHIDYGRLAIGNYPHGITDKTKYIAELFNSAKVDCEVQDKIL
jgi:2-dehydropantoate 2-reductase